MSDTYKIDITISNGCVQTKIIDILDIEGISPNIPTQIDLKYGFDHILILEDPYKYVEVVSSDERVYDIQSPQTLVIHGITSHVLDITVMDSVGCEYNIIIQVNVDNGDELNIPNVIWANSSQSKNAIWRVDFPPHYQLINCTVKDRWGSIVYASNNEIRWDGTSMGKPCQAGVYLYEFSYTLPHGDRVVRQGDITVIR